jgi:PilZ domain
LLRQRFAALAQFRAHLQTMDGSTLLFFRDPATSLAIGAEALLEIAFDNSEDTWVVRAKVVVRAEGQGLWLVVPTARFAREALEGDLVVRKGRRLGAEKVLRLRRQSGSQYLVMLADLSLGGARISGVPPGLARDDLVEIALAAPQPGEPVDPIAARVVWCDESDAGIEIDRRKATSRAAVTKLFRVLEERWRGALEMRHLDLCCKDGKLLDPPPPRVRNEGKRKPSQD